jgi:chromosome segregation ATPase
MVMHPLERQLRELQQEKDSLEAEAEMHAEDAEREFMYAEDLRSEAEEVENRGNDSENEKDRCWDAVACIQIEIDEIQAKIDAGGLEDGRAGDSDDPDQLTWLEES